MTTIYNRIAGRSADRLAALSDGVFAFAMTVLALDLHVPSAFAVANETGLQHAEGNFAAPVRSNKDRRWAAKVEILVVPNVGLDDPPAADEFAVHRRSHAGAAMSFGSRIRL